MSRDKNNGKFMLDEVKKNKRLGEMKYNNRGSLMKIIEYNDCRNVIVEFQDEHKTRIKCRYSQFKDGILTSPYDKSVYGIGFLGEGKYKASENGKKTKAYEVWDDMLKRCYDPIWVNKHLTYIDCYVEEYFHCFQNFAEWYEKEHYKCNSERMNLDKDILEKGNKIYDREHMIFVPERINKLFVKRDTRRGEYPIGVKFNKSKNALESACGITENGKQIYEYLGTFPLSEPFHAFYTYKIFKENYIKQVADEYKDLIPQRLYEAMYKYEVEIND